MAKKEALRELQSRLAERLQAARLKKTETATWLAVECGGQGMLLPLGQAGEIFPLATLMPVPHTTAWFLGVANLRGRLHGVVDLAAFLGLRASAASELGPQSRLIAFNPALEVNCALLVDRLAGLRSADQLRVLLDDAVHPAFAGARYIDAGGRRWQEIVLAELAGEEAFLRIAR
ncbi:chemotaxis protein CheW [Methylibium sp.]|uniref:chemotaxis protein CheW n=1 Tax=Methylibium sp. TaxID=2067992 RepID=UPI003D0F365C